MVGTRKPSCWKSGSAIDDGRRRDVIEEATVFVEGDHQQRSRPLRALGQRSVDAGDERFAQPQVVRRVTVVQVEVGIDEREVRQLAGGSVAIEVIHRLRDHGVVAREAVGRERDRIPGDRARVVVLPGPAPVRQPLPDRGRRRQPHRHVRLLAGGRARVQVEAVRPRRPHHRREPAIADGVFAGQRVQERQLFAGVVPHGLALIGAGVDLHEAVVAAAVERAPGRRPVVPWIERAVASQLARHDRRAVDVWIALGARDAVYRRRRRVYGVQLQAAQQVVERSVLQHHDDERVDRLQQAAGGTRSGFGSARAPVRHRPATGPCRRARQRARAQPQAGFQRIATRELLLRLRRQDFTASAGVWRSRQTSIRAARVACKGYSRVSTTNLSSTTGAPASSAKRTAFALSSTESTVPVRRATPS